MSYSQLKAFDKNGDAVGLEEFRNSHYLQVIWNRLAEKYGVLEKIRREIARERGVPEGRIDRYEVGGRLMMDMKPVWDLQKSPDISDDDWRCLLFTFDNAVVRPEDIEAFAAAFEKFEVGDRDVVNHGAGFARCMRKALSSIEGIRGVALYGTSICGDPWGGVPLPIEQCGECGAPIRINGGGEAECTQEPEDHYIDHDYRPYNLDLDEKHWFIPSRDDHLRSLR